RHTRSKRDWSSDVCSSDLYSAFGFAPGNIAPALLLFGLLAGVVTFWLSPLVHSWSRRYEYQADAFAAEVIHESRPLVAALRKLKIGRASCRESVEVGGVEW